MIPRLYDANTTDFNSNGEGLLLGAYDWEIYEEDNGDFTAKFKYPCTGRLFNYIKRGAIIKALANKKAKNQKFRVFSIEPNQDSMSITVTARHKSFDTVYDFIPTNIEIQNQSCEYALNKIFQNSLFCKNYIGESDIVNAQNFTIGYVTPAEAIRGKEGSLADTYGNGSHIIRDNSEIDKIKIMAKRGTTRDILLAYGKNITGFTGKEDDTDLITRIIPYAKYTPEGGEEITYRPTTFTYVDSANAGDYYGIYFSREIDFTNKLAENEVPTDEFLLNCCETYYIDNKCNFPKISYTIKFQDLNSTTLAQTNVSKLYDVEIGDSLMVWHKPFNMNTEVRVIATKFDPVTEEYIEIILGDPRSTLAEIINSGASVIKGEKGDPGEKGQDGSDGDIGDFPDTIPSVPVVALSSGLATVEITWTFEAKTYYTYEVYASMDRNFSPTAFDKVFEGKASSYLMKAKPNQTWYVYVRAVNSYGKATAFSTLKSISTAKIDDATMWFDNLAIGDALIGDLRLDRGWIGKLNANLLDVKGNFSVTDGNGARTFNIDSYGNVSIQATTLSIIGKDVATQEYSSTQSATAFKNAKDYADGIKSDVLGEVADVRGSVGDLTSTMNGAFKDGIIDEAEATAIEQRIVQLDKEKADLDSKYNTMYANIHLTGTAKSNLALAKTDFNSSHTKLKERINEVISDSKVTEEEKVAVAYSTALYNNSIVILTRRFEEAVDNIAQNKASNVVNAQTQEDIFNKLTKNGTVEGITMVDGQLFVNGQYINAKNLSVTNADGTKTLKIDNFGNVTLNVAELKLNSKDIITAEGVEAKGYQTASQVKSTVDGLELKFSDSGGYNLLSNSGFKTGDLSHWGIQNYNSAVGGWSIRSYVDDWGFPDKNIKTFEARMSNQTEKEYGISQTFNTTKGKEYTVSFYYASHRCSRANLIIRNMDGTWTRNIFFNPSAYGGNGSASNWNRMVFTFTATQDYHILNIVLNDAQDNGFMWVAKPMVTEGNVAKAYSPAPNEIYDGITTIDKNGITVTASNVNSKTNMSANGFRITKTDTGENVFVVNSDGRLSLIGTISAYNNGRRSGYFGNDILIFYNWATTANEEIAWIYSGFRDDSPEKGGLALVGKNYLALGMDKPNGPSYITLENNYIHNYKHTNYHGWGIENIQRINFDAVSQDLWMNKLFFRTNQINTAMDSGYLNLNYWRSSESAMPVTVRVSDGNNTGDRGALQCGNFKAYGTKNACVQTSVGYVDVSAYETAEYYFGDIGETILDNEGYGYVYIESIFRETISPTHKYQVFLSVYGEGFANVIERTENYFVIKGTPGIEIGYEIKGKRKGYEDYRLEKEANSFVKGQEHGLDNDYLGERETFNTELEKVALDFDLDSSSLELTVNSEVESSLENKSLLNIIEEGVNGYEDIN